MLCTKCGQEYEGSQCPRCDGPVILVNNSDYLARRKAYEEKQALKERSASSDKKEESQSDYGQALAKRVQAIKNQSRNKTESKKQSQNRSKADSRKQGQSSGKTGGNRNGNQEKPQIRIARHKVNKRMKMIAAVLIAVVLIGVAAFGIYKLATKKNYALYVSYNGKIYDIAGLDSNYVCDESDAIFAADSKTFYTAQWPEQIDSGKNILSVASDNGKYFVTVTYDESNSSGRYSMYIWSKDECVLVSEDNLQKEIMYISDDGLVIYTNINIINDEGSTNGTSLAMSRVKEVKKQPEAQTTLIEGNLNKAYVYESKHLIVCLTNAGSLYTYDYEKKEKPVSVADADYVVMESTYGNRSHNGTPDYVAELVKVFKRTFDRGGNVVIPSFAVGRTQELLYHIRKIKADGLMDRDFDVYVDSPLAIEATEVFSKNVEQCFDEDAIELVRQGINPLSFPGLKYAISSEESKMINFDTNPKVIISASGMCEAGRIRHHLKHNLWRPECTILFVGYQANGTTGRIIVDGIDEIKLFGEPIQVKAEIAQLPGSSGHADKDGLIHWVNAFTNKPRKVFVVHGEDSVCEEFTQCLKEEYGFDAYAPYTGTSFDLITGQMIAEGNKEKKSRRTTVNKRNKSVFDRLVAAGKRLMSVIAHNEGGANKDLAKFTDQINSLCDKWDR